MNCNYCGEINPSGNNFCVRCGTPLSGSLSPVGTKSQVDAITNSGLTFHNPALASSLRPELVDMLKKWEASANKAVLAIHLMGRNYPLRALEALQDLIKQSLILPSTPVFHRPSDRWYEANQCLAICKEATFDPEATHKLQIEDESDSSGDNHQAEGLNQGKMILAAKLGCEAEEAANENDYQRAIEIYEQVLQLNQQYPLVKKRLRQLNQLLTENPPKKDKKENLASYSSRSPSAALPPPPVAKSAANAPFPPPVAKSTANPPPPPPVAKSAANPPFPPPVAKSAANAPFPPSPSTGTRSMSDVPSSAAGMAPSSQSAALGQSPQKVIWGNNGAIKPSFEDETIAASEVEVEIDDQPIILNRVKSRDNLDAFFPPKPTPPAANNVSRQPKMLQISTQTPDLSSSVTKEQTSEELAVESNYDSGTHRWFELSEAEKTGQPVRVALPTAPAIDPKEPPKATKKPHISVNSELLDGAYSNWQPSTSHTTSPVSKPSSPISKPISADQHSTLSLLPGVPDKIKPNLTLDDEDDYTQLSSELEQINGVLAHNTSSSNPLLQNIPKPDISDGLEDLVALVHANWHISHSLADIDWEALADLMCSMGFEHYQADRLKLAFVRSSNVCIIKENQEIIAVARSISDGEYQAVICDISLASRYQAYWPLYHQLITHLKGKLREKRILLIDKPEHNQFAQRLGFHKDKHTSLLIQM